MALEPLTTHECAHAVHGPTYRANHERIFGRHKRDVPEVDDGATAGLKHADYIKLTPSHGMRLSHTAPPPSPSPVTRENAEHIAESNRTCGHHGPEPREECDGCARV